MGIHNFWVRSLAPFSEQCVTTINKALVLTTPINMVIIEVGNEELFLRFFDS